MATNTIVFPGTQPRESLPKLHRTVPLVDGFLLNVATGELHEILNGIRVNDTTVLEPSTYSPVTINQNFFYTINDAKRFLVKQYRNTAAQMNKIADTMLAEIEADIITEMTTHAIE
jgi:hypothetical protein